jgi:spermidine synthase
VIAPLLILPPTLLMGASFPYLQKASQTDLAVLGRRVGWLQTANILGATVGVVVVGALLLGWLGTSGTLRVMIGLGLVFLLLWWRLRAERPLAVRRIGAAASVGAVALVMALVPASPTLWGKLHGSTAERVLFSEDATGLSVIKSGAPDFSGTCTIYANGVGQSSVPFGGVHTELGLLSVALHPARVDFAISGLGSGDTRFAAGGRGETRSITSIEIIGPELETLRQLHARRPYGGLASIFDDARIRHVFTDGRSMILRGEARYDVIEADAVIPVSAYSGNLYSEEYFALLKRRLKPGGYAVTWSPTPRTRSSFVRVFPHVAGFESFLIGSESPIVFDQQEALARLDRPEVRARYALAGIDAHAMMERLLTAYRPAPPGFDRSLLGDTNSDLFPRDEFAVP